MKKVFSNSDQVIHVWAQQNQHEGRSANVFFEGAVLYSYGYHYPLGLIATNKKGEKAAIINDAGYSKTTSKHIGAARYAVNHYTRFSVPNTKAMKALCEAQRYNQPVRITNALSEAIEARINTYNSSLRSDVNRRATTLEKWKDETLAECNNYIALLDWYGLKMTAKAKKAIKAFTGKSPIEAREAAQKAAAKEDKLRAIAQAKRDKENEAIIAQSKIEWLAGNNEFIWGDSPHYTRNWIHWHKETLLRVKGEEVETSKGASFPVRHAVKAFALIQSVMKSGEAWERNGKTLHLGHYQVDRIEPSGTVIAGCHVILYPAIEYVAKQLKLI